MKRFSFVARLLAFLLFAFVGIVGAFVAGQAAANLPEMPNTPAAYTFALVQLAPGFVLMFGGLFASRAIAKGA